MCSPHDQVAVTGDKVHVMHKLLKKRHLHVKKDTKLATLQSGWLLVRRTPSVQTIKMLAINFTDVLL